MPIVDGQYQEQISTVFKTNKEAIEQIKGKIAKSRRVRISSIPMSLLEELLPLLQGKDVKLGLMYVFYLMNCSVRVGLQKLKGEQTQVSHLEFELDLSAFELGKFPLRFLLIRPKDRQSRAVAGDLRAVTETQPFDDIVLSVAHLHSERPL